MDTKTVAQQFTQLCKDGKFDEAGSRFWADNVVSLEPMEGPMARAEGRKALEAKGQWWYENHEIHGTTTEGPFVHGDQFAVNFTMDVTPKTGEMAGKRFQMSEVALYTVKDGKVVEERYLYGGE
jgi:ketosteroid isomerase-like protein